MPPNGALEEGRRRGAELSDEEMEEESRDRRELVDHVTPRVAALLVAISGPGFEPDEVLPPEAEATIVGAYDLLQTWPPSEQG